MPYSGYKDLAIPTEEYSGEEYCASHTKEYAGEEYCASQRGSPFSSWPDQPGSWLLEGY